MHMYFTILELDDHNCAGAIGIANVLNEYDKTHESKEIYKLLVNSEPASVTGLHARVNQAHITMWKKTMTLLSIYILQLWSSSLTIWKLVFIFPRPFLGRKTTNSARNCFYNFSKNTHMIFG